MADSVLDSDEQMVEVQEVEIEAIPIQIKDEIDSDEDNNGINECIPIELYYSLL